MVFPILSSCPNFDGFVRTPKPCFYIIKILILQGTVFREGVFTISLLLAEMIDNMSTTLL